jgi:hypothetical protein
MDRTNRLMLENIEIAGELKLGTVIALMNEKILITKE